MDKIKKIDIELLMIRTTKLPFVLGKEELTKEENENMLDLLSIQKTLVEDLQIELNKKLVNISNQQREITLRNK
jgi:hypothetical protein